MSNLLLRKAGLAFDKTKASVALTKAAFALVLLVEAKAAAAKTQRSKVALELESGLEHQASMDVEQLIRQDLEISAYETLRRHCNLLEDRLKLVASQKECPAEVKQAVCTIIWAADKGEVPEEMLVVKAQLVKKYGKDFTVRAQNNENGCVNKMVSEKLLLRDMFPSASLVDDYLASISSEVKLAAGETAPKCTPSEPGSKPVKTAPGASLKAKLEAATAVIAPKNASTDAGAPDETPENTPTRKKTPKAPPLETNVGSPSHTPTITPTGSTASSTSRVDRDVPRGGRAPPLPRFNAAPAAVRRLSVELSAS